MSKTILTIGKGFLFGMTLQLAIGPVCLFILNCGIKDGFIHTLSGVSAIACVDALYMSLAIGGFARMISSPKAKKILGITGVFVVCAFGIKMTADSLGAAAALSVATQKSLPIFLSVFLLTASNPLTILFFAGVFAAKIGEHGADITSVIFFAIGCLLATISFMSAVAGAGSVLQSLFEVRAIRILNAIVGVALCVFAGMRLYRILVPEITFNKLE
jgi:threonine/homoserine/homoserine lactone efflux protein